MKQVYTIVCTWTMTGTFEIEAESITEAKEKVWDTSLTDAIDSDYVDDTFNIDHDSTGDGNP